MIVDHEDRVTPWSPFPYYDLARVRVWIRRTPFGFFQRHEWEALDGTTRLDAWIIRPGRQFPATAEAAESPPGDLDLMLAALEAIAAGHNDARGLALETLEKIRSPG